MKIETMRGGAVAAALLLAAGGAVAAEKVPDTMVWSTYDVGSTGYVEASAVADAFGKKYGTRVRLQPSGTSIGRLLPLKTKRVSYAWLANEAYFAAEGLYDFAAPDWGPQDLRVMLGRVNGFSVVATKVSGITDVASLKGKRFAYVAANASVNVKIDGLLAFADLTWKDMVLVPFPNYGASLKALVEGKADAAGAAPNAATLYELASSPNGITWVPLPADNAKGWTAVQKAVPFLEPFNDTIGAGISAEKPAAVMGYRYPMVTIYAEADAGEVYAVTKALIDTYDLYKDVNPIMPRWHVSKSGTPPMDAAFHDGAVRALKEAGVWTPASQAWQDKALKRQKALQAAWAQATADAKARNVPAEGFAKFWEEYRTKALAAL
ncbi:TAXI family TRAP transporter solute-binding subunit [Stella sp.]|uniref:TAXI family TRAP transporter solute-binding subunit n=1 Tax=Stella sp. TaxID=2912054 RepID=UPI0035B1C8B5